MWVILLLAATMTISMPCSTAAIGPSLATSAADTDIEALALEIFEPPGRPQMAVAQYFGRNGDGKLDPLLGGCRRREQCDQQQREQPAHGVRSLERRGIAAPGF